VDSTGCPRDSDNDGVNDCDDDCLHEPGDPSNRGCPNNSFLLDLSHYWWIIGIAGILLIFSIFIFYQVQGRNRKKVHEAEFEKRNLDEMLKKGLVSEREHEIASKEIEEQIAQREEHQDSEG
jgi:hypothetical protein